MNITNYFSEIIKLQKEMGYGFPNFLNKPATELDFLKLEILNIGILSYELKELYQIANGTTIPAELQIGKSGLFHGFRFLSLQDAYDFYLQEKELKSKIETDFFDGLFPLMENGARDFYWVDLNKEHYGMIYYTTTTGDYPAYVYSSLTHFMKTIYIAYRDKVFSLDADGLLDCDWNLWGDINRKLNPEIDYWKNY